MKYIKELDSIRAIAVFFVVAQHWYPFNAAINSIPLSWMGVNVFFILSGFLISNILIKNEAEAEGVSKWHLIKAFYIRRSLRIFPVYYLVIILLFVFKKNIFQQIHEALGYLLTYTQNFYFLKINAWDGVISHLWSLAVEEQFYLLWPFIILFVSKRHLLTAILTVAAISFLSQIVFGHLKMHRVITTNCFEMFTAGALLAWAINYKLNYTGLLLKYLNVFGPAALLIFLGNSFFDNWLHYFDNTLSCIFGSWIIFYVYINHSKKNLLIEFLSKKVLVYLGRISYGLYLYHNFIPLINNLLISGYINPRLSQEFSKKYFGILFLAENLILLIAIASLSYYFIERPFLRLKKVVKYQQPAN